MSKKIHLYSCACTCDTKPCHYLKSLQYSRRAPPNLDFLHGPCTLSSKEKRHRQIKTCFFLHGPKLQPAGKGHFLFSYPSMSLEKFPFITVPTAQALAVPKPTCRNMYMVHGNIHGHMPLLCKTLPVF